MKIFFYTVGQCNENTLSFYECIKGLLCKLLLKSYLWLQWSKGTIFPSEMLWNWSIKWHKMERPCSVWILKCKWLRIVPEKSILVNIYFSPTVLQNFKYSDAVSKLCENMQRNKTSIISMRSRVWIYQPQDQVRLRGHGLVIMSLQLYQCLFIYSVRQVCFTVGVMWCGLMDCN